MTPRAIALSSSAIDNMLVAVLSADPALMAIATDGVFFDEADPGCTRFVLCAVQTSHDEGDFDGVAWEQPQYLVKIVLARGTNADARQAADRIEAVLQDLETRLDPAQLPNYHLTLCQRLEYVRYREHDPDAADLWWQHRGGQYEVWAQPIPLAARAAA
jgi:hypothetical protein